MYPIHVKITIYVLFSYHYLTIICLHSLYYFTQLNSSTADYSLTCIYNLLNNSFSVNKYALRFVYKNTIPHLSTEYVCNKTVGPGPHPQNCLRIWWLKAGCTMVGNGAPHQVAESSYWNTNSVAVVKNDMAAWYTLAVQGYCNYPVACFGIL